MYQVLYILVQRAKGGRWCKLIVMQIRPMEGACSAAPEAYLVFLLPLAASFRQLGMQMRIYSLALKPFGILTYIDGRGRTSTG